jgi:cell division protein FtsN
VSELNAYQTICKSIGQKVKSMRTILFTPKTLQQLVEELPMNGLERRLTPRTEWLADIHFEPNNGGIVLNLSEGGLCFHAIDPLQIDSTIRFSVSLHNQRIQGAGQLAWIDQAKRTGGLRFTGLPADARQQVRDWTTQPAISPSTDDASPHPVLPLRVFPATTAIQPEKKADFALVSSGRKGLVSLSGFSAGLGAGILVSALVAAAFSFHTYRRQFGASIIQFGERVAASPKTQAHTVLPAVLPPSPAVSNPVAPIAFPQPSESVLQPTPNPPAPQPAPVPPKAKSEAESVSPTISWLIADGGSRPKPPETTSSAPTTSTPPSLPPANVTVPSYSYLVPSKLGPAPPLAPSSQPDVHAVVSGREDVASPSEMFFEVGKFKDQPPAGEVTDRLTKFGFHASVTQKGRFWGNSYYVLVGPYDNDRDAKAAHKSLSARGFKPRAFERGSRAFRFSYVLTLNGAHIPAGDCSIRWESYSSLVIVQFVQNNDVIATVDGRWTKRDVMYNQSAYGFTRSGDGSRNLVELRFAGMRQALIFDKSS